MSIPGRAAHKLHGTAATAGAYKVQSAAGAFEDAVHLGKIADLGQILRDIEEAMDEALRSIQSLGPEDTEVQKDVSRSDKPFSASERETLYDLVAELQDLVSLQDMDARDCFSSIQSLYADRTVPKNLREVGEHLDVMDFPSALKCLQGWSVASSENSFR